MYSDSLPSFFWSRVISKKVNVNKTGIGENRVLRIGRGCECDYERPHPGTVPHIAASIGWRHLPRLRNFDDWEGTKVYQDEAMNTNSHRQNDCPQKMSWTDQRIKSVVTAAGINYKPGFFSRLF